MYRVESEQSIGDSDENIMEHLMEGGATIRRQTDRKQQVRVPVCKIIYSFNTHF